MNAEPLLELPDLLRERRLGDEETLGGTGQVSLLGYGGEVPKQSGIDIHAGRLSKKELDGHQLFPESGTDHLAPKRGRVMHIYYSVVTIIAIIANAGIAIADLAEAKFVVANSAEVGVPSAWLPFLAALKLAGAAGLLVGMLGWEPIGLAAAVGLVLFFAGAIVAHIRAQVYHNIAFPAAYLVLASAALALSVAAGRVDGWSN
ncbi:DoxX family protein [Catenuloplanes atrovinosus]|uniref:DoxX family protein n=1 Tax=Catenuloplanes atrovinosus TaxID=137266 RepID=A0AAE4C9U0_9ACTN|nr:DoxX family protein [Catenuloplanes atrovinosus]MDR7275144.1 hypothetical protein [Catenuloplanes atrovinosus]